MIWEAILRQIAKSILILIWLDLGIQQKLEAFLLIPNRSRRLSE